MVSRNKLKLGGRHSLQTAVTLARRARRAGKRVVTTNGCFDILHVGHIRNLTFARSLGDILLVGINSDASVRSSKGAGRPIVPARERCELLSALRAVDCVFVFSDVTPRAWLAKIRPDVHVKGADRKLHTGKALESDVVEKYGGRVVFFNHTGHSTTRLLKRARGAT